ncbi:unnamed protein product [Arabis nemorensis]|uniref:26S proteasome regulatory subunit Rpn7 N-terminal domain-containing protein n=1 Tax=Arabis nemorensis TaxID=586526 RepID=A0A565B8G5_9BRAS|nr:unnamed protein product [Arabis nemorensis]
MDVPLDIDVQEYANRYKGRNKLLRLVHIARMCSSHPLVYSHYSELESLAIAYDAIKSDPKLCDIEIFKMVVEQIHGRLGMHYENDDVCIIKEICVLLSPFSGRSRSIHACMLTVLVAIETRNFGHVRHRTLLQIAYYHQEKEYKFKLNCATAIADLGEKCYEKAAEGFIALLGDVNEFAYNEVVSSEDIVVYGLTCALATYEPSKLKETLLEVTEPIGGVAHHLKDIIKPYGPGHHLINIIKHFNAE